MSRYSHHGRGALLHEDLVFADELARYGCLQRRDVCLNGHSVYVGMPQLEPPRILPTKLPIFRRRKRQTPKPSTTGKKLSPAELRMARAIPRPWNSWARNRTAPQAYAARPTKLDQKWA